MLESTASLYLNEYNDDDDDGDDDDDKADTLIATHRITLVTVS